MSTRHSSGKAAQNPELRDAWLRPFEATARGSGWQPPTQTFMSASLAEPGQARATALARAYLDYSRSRGDPRGADARAAQLVLDRAQRGDLTRPPTHTVEGSRYQRERALQANIRSTRAWLYGVAFMGDHGSDATHYNQDEEAERERERTAVVKGGHVRDIVSQEERDAIARSVNQQIEDLRYSVVRGRVTDPEEVARIQAQIDDLSARARAAQTREYDLYTTSGLPLRATTAERDRAQAQADLANWQRQLDTLLAQKDKEAAQHGRPNESNSRRAVAVTRRLAG